MTEKIVFGGGCFWCIEAIYQMLKGVVKVTSGYAGKEGERVNYYSGNAEVVEVEYDPSIITLENLYAVFFTAHDPTSLNKQGADTGPQYRSVILYTTQEQKVAAENFMKKLAEEKVYSKPIVTDLEPLEKFHEAEPVHQNYYNNNQNYNPYCQVVIDPKINKIKKSFAHLINK